MPENKLTGYTLTYKSIPYTFGSRLRGSGACRHILVGQRAQRFDHKSSRVVGILVKGSGGDGDEPALSGNDIEGIGGDRTP